MLKILNLNQTEENPVKQKYKRNKHALRGKFKLTQGISVLSKAPFL